MNKFHDRSDAGRKLADKLRHYTADMPIVLALPRGGVPVGLEIARELSAPLDVWVVRKIGVPWQPELAMGAVAEGDFAYIDHEMAPHLRLSIAEVTAALDNKRREVEARVQKFRHDRPPPALAGRTVIVVDDGIATSATARAAILSIRAQHPDKLVLAAPVAAPHSVRALEPEVDDIEVLLVPQDMYAIGFWYEDFRQVTDDEVVDTLDSYRRERSEDQADHPDRGDQHRAGSP